MSNVNAVISEPPSLPLKTMSSSVAVVLIFKSLFVLEKTPKTVPLSFKFISPPSTSIFKSPPMSKVRFPASVILDPLIVISSTVSTPNVPVPEDVTPALAVTAPPAEIVPDTSKLPFKSTVVAAI